MIEKIIHKIYMSILDLQTRPMTQFLKDSGMADMVGVEIGVAKGKHAEQMLKKLNIKKLYLIDPYITYFDRDEFINKTFINNYPEARERLEKFKDKVVWIKKCSWDAVDGIPNDVDFVYVDGNHSYESVKRDIELYFPKVKKGGIIGGHDFHTSLFGVCRAVVEFAVEKKMKFNGKTVDWWFIK